MPNKPFDTPEAAEAAFYAAFSTLDVALMSTVWADGEGVLCIHPGGGLLQGKHAVIQSWTEIFSGGEPPRIEHRYIDGYGVEGLEVRVVEERIRPRGRPPGAANRVLATNVYRNTGGSWRMVEHHASLPLVDEEDESRDEKRLH